MDVVSFHLSLENLIPSQDILFCMQGVLQGAGPE